MKEIDRNSEQVLSLISKDPVAHRARRDEQALMWLGQTIRRARKSAGLTQTKVAVDAGMTQADLSRLENGLPAKGVTFTTLVGLSEALGFNIVFELRPKAGATPARTAVTRGRSALEHLTVRDSQ